MASVMMPRVRVLFGLDLQRRMVDAEALVQRMLGLRSGANDVSLEVTRGVTRPVWEADAKGMALFEQARKIANDIGFDINPQSSGGGSDGNFTGAMGTPTLDGLGVLGDGPHTHHEHLLISCLVPRTRLLARLFETLPA